MNEKGQENVHEDVLRLKEFWESKGKPLVMAAVIVVLAFSAVMLIRQRIALKAETASRMLSRIKNAQELEEFIAKYGSTPSGPIAMLGLAKANYNAGNYDVALNKYIEFEARYPKHPMLAVAVLGKAHCVEAKGDLQSALSSFSSFIEKNPEHFLLPQAVLGKARCLDALGRSEEARIVYEDFIAANPESEWAAIAHESLAKIERKRRAENSTGGIQPKNKSEIVSPAAPAIDSSPSEPSSQQ